MDVIDEKLQKDPISVIAHDLRVPLSAVKGYIELTQKNGELSPTQAKFLERALLGVERIGGIIDAWLDLTKLESEGAIALVDTDMARVVNSAVELMENMAAQRSITIHVNLPAGLEPIHGDPARLGQVVSNLLSNAIKYNRDGGAVTVEVLLEPGFVRVSVRDTGDGIEPEDLPRVFDRMFRARRRDRTEGVGLGLAITRMIVLKHGGDIWAESVVGEGSTFTFRLPRAGTAGRDGVEHDAQDARAGRDGRVSAADALSEAAVETPDAVDDDLQEAASAADTDSSSDFV